ncbi:uncharacterized protein LOC144710689 [Wolffia australiana]
MDIPLEIDDYIKESIENSLGLPVSEKTLQMKLLVSEDERRRLQDKIFTLQGLLADAERRLERMRAEANMNALGLKRCIEDKELMSSRNTELANQCAKFEKECTLYERDIERLMESCDDLARENEELKSQLRENSVTVLVSEMEGLKKDKEHLRINLNRAEEEVTALFDENSILVEENKRLLKLLNRETNSQGSDGKSAFTPNKGKRKTSPLDRSVESDGMDLSRQPLIPLVQNSPNSRLHKK